MYLKVSLNAGGVPELFNPARFTAYYGLLPEYLSICPGISLCVRVCVCERRPQLSYQLSFSQTTSCEPDTPK